MSRSPTYRYSKPRNIQQLLTLSPFFQRLKSQQHTQLLAPLICQFFPSHLCPHFRIGEISQHILRIDVANAMARYALLKQEQYLLTQLQKSYPNVKKIQFFIDPQLGKSHYKNRGVMNTKKVPD